MYDDYEIYQFVESKQDKRIRIILKHKENVRDYKLISYPKYLMECHLGRYLLENETIDHIDGDYLNNDISNLQVIDRTEHCKLDAIRNEDVLVYCTQCGKPFIIEGSKLHSRNRKDKHQSGYFCSRKCSGKYGAEIQKGLKQHKVVEKVKPKKYKLKDKN